MNLLAESKNVVCSSTPTLGLMLNTPLSGGPLISIVTPIAACLASSLNVTDIPDGTLNGARTKLNLVELNA